MKVYSNALEIIGFVMFMLGVAIALWRFILQRGRGSGLLDVLLVGVLVILGAIVMGIGSRRAKKT